MSLFDTLAAALPFGRAKRLKEMAGYRQALADRVDDGIAVIDLKGNVQFVNSAWALMHNYDAKDQLVGRHIRQFYSRRVAEDVNRFIAQTKLLGWYVTSVEQLRKDGTGFAAQLKMAVLKDDSSNPYAVLFIVADTSRISRMQKTIQQTNQELEQLKARLNLLEKTSAARAPAQHVHSETADAAASSRTAPPLPIAELKHLAEMAKRFR